MKYSKYKIYEDKIAFDFYEFHFSSLRKNKVLTLNRIKEVDFNTFPYTMKIDNGEIIFFNHGDTEEIKNFAERNHIKQSNKIDVWSLLCNEFLDTEIEKEEAEKQKATLLHLGFTESELTAIRKKIKWSLFGTWEWTYLGHWDVLAMKQNRNPFYRFNGANFYWWTMEIALKGKVV
ncbi:hypothetical protein [Maribacter sp. 2210JD10-5]|uniref:hypothetical protein n=1 Tax=Maribacter sp. 2210JD10-5 TaxID=3386272 RepID=UPI0039BC3786